MIIKEIENAQYIENWNQVPNGTLVIEDTYNELYRLERKDGVPILYHIGWRYTFGKPIEDFESRDLNPPRQIDFEPNCMYDQPWLMETNNDS